MNKVNNVNSKIFGIRYRYIAIVVLIASSLWASVFSHIDDINYTQIMENGILHTTDMKDSECTYDISDGDALIIQRGEGIKLFSGAVNLQKGDALEVSFVANNKSEKKAKLIVDLYGEDYDDPCDEVSVIVNPGNNKIRRTIAYYRDDHPTKCQLRIFTSDEKELEIRDFNVDKLVVTRDGNKLLNTLAHCMRAIALVVAVYLIGFALNLLVTKKHARVEIASSKETKPEITLYVFTVISVVAILLFLYRSADITLPLIYAGGDEMGVFYLAKNIDQNGLSLVNPYIGGQSGGDLFDYPYSDSMSFLCVKVIGLLTDNPYLIINLFYFINYVATAVISVAVSRKLKVSRISSYIVGILYAFSPFMQMRYVHIWLTPYYVLPIACLLSINIIKGRVPDTTCSEARKQVFWRGMILSLLCAFTGMYYAYFACALFAASMVIRFISMNGKRGKSELYPLAYISSTVIGIIINIVPNLMYWGLAGQNQFGELALRNRGDVETFGLKLVQLILPRIGHRISLFSRIAVGYFRNYPLVNENSTASIGIVASFGLLVSLLLLFSQNNKFKEISWLNFSTFIIATIGGIGSIISVAIVLPMRCYNRMSLIIMFLSLLMIGMMLDQLKQRTKSHAVLLVCLCVLITGIFDQTVNYAPYDATSFNNTQHFFRKIEDEMKEADMVFTLPYLDWPSSSVEGSYGMFSGYLETSNMHWSYGAMEGREEAEWQKAVAKCEPAEMIGKLKDAGYAGIYLDKRLYEHSSKKNKDKADAYINMITAETGTEPLVSEDQEKYFWKIK